MELDVNLIYRLFALISPKDWVKRVLGILIARMTIHGILYLFYY